MILVTSSFASNQILLKAFGACLQGTAEEQPSKQWAAKKERKNKNYFVHVESSLDYGYGTTLIKTNKHVLSFSFNFDIDIDKDVSESLLRCR
ncbi:hypothetical protein MTR_1g082515 [Medicago truncatula]|uniref:Uncharacterized protein n=1 Tax=Medicago truncatula TaxID=3880 RepID=A0A072VNS5_MEDTR|nr:hypothetical protein MTR_1g082515 [Medicago truncatula]